MRAGRRITIRIRDVLKHSLSIDRNPCCRSSELDEGHIIISGTGRAGTTLLVQILTHLGLDTGFTKEQCLKNVDAVSNAGLEHSLLKQNLPEVVKSPWFSDEIKLALKQGVKVRHAIIPFRDLYSAAESRRLVSAKAEQAGSDPLAAAGGLWKTQRPNEQEDVLVRQFYSLLECLVQNDIPVTLLAFPKFADDVNYFYKQMRPILEGRIEFSEFARVCSEIIDRNKVRVRAQEI